MSRKTQFSCSSSRDVLDEVKDEANNEIQHILEYLIQDGASAERSKGEVVIFFAGKGGDGLKTGIASSFLAPLIEVAALSSHSHLGRVSFKITAEGREVLRRLLAHRASFAAQHQNVEWRILTDEKADKATKKIVAVNRKEDPLDLFKRRRYLAHFVGTAEIEAGERLMQDFRMAQVVPSFSSNWNDSGVRKGGGGAPLQLSMPEAVVEAKRRVDKIFHQLNPDFANILIDVCGFCKGIEDVEKEHDFPLRSGKVVLALALRDLARCYGLSNSAIGSSRAKIVSWRQGKNPVQPSVS